MQNRNDQTDNLIFELKQKRNVKEMEDYLMQKLNPAKTEELERILRDPQAAQNLLNTPEAQALLKKLLENR